MAADSQKQIEMQLLQTEHWKRQQEHLMHHNNIQEIQAQITKGQLNMSNAAQSLMFLPFLEQFRGLPVSSPMPPPNSASTTGNKHINSIANMISSRRENQGWATPHLTQTTTQLEKERSPTPITSSAIAQTPSANLPDPDAPLNLTKPKSSSSSTGAPTSASPGSDSHHSTGAGSSGQQEQPLVATAPKLFSPGLPVSRNYLPNLSYAGLPPHLSSLSSPIGKVMVKDDNGASGSAAAAAAVEKHFAMHGIYSLPPPNPGTIAPTQQPQRQMKHSAGNRGDDRPEEDQDFLSSPHMWRDHPYKVPDDITEKGE
ncbi:hypothetical protein PV326_009433 [Microctonus aethiopoides]|nr:hypothetical protein PV326_009433 [Microctonus aethiopoides]